MNDKNGEILNQLGPNHEMLPMIHTIPIISNMLRIISKVFPMLLRHHYTSERLNALIKLDISASGDGVTFNYGAQSANCWFVATNLSPFDFSIDRIVVDVGLDAGAFSCTRIMPENLKEAENCKIYVESRRPMTIEAAKFAKDRSTRARVTIRAYITSSIRPFIIEKSIEDLKNFQLYT
jgi:hypothetical protein